MADERSKKCAKCGISSSADPGITFHRFPLPCRSTNASLKAKVWAKYCFPNDDWSSEQSLNNLFKSGKYLCGKHFDGSAFTSDDKTRLNKFAIPYEAKNIMAQEREAINDYKQTVNAQRQEILEEMVVKSLTEPTPKKQKNYEKCERENLYKIQRLTKNFKVTKKSNRYILEAVHKDETVKEDYSTILNKIPLTCGINEQIMESIKEIAYIRATRDNLCVLAFDDMSIGKNLSYYNEKSDQIDVNQDHADQENTKEVIKALTFMAVGLKNKWEQPIAYYFSGANVTVDMLSAHIKEVLSACLKAGLEVVGTVCDCDDVNLLAINALGSSTDQPYFIFEGRQIVTILDPPHLLKCFRNDFIKYNIQFPKIEPNGKKSIGVAKWSHIEDFYNVDHCNTFFVFAPALTREHLYPNEKQKMDLEIAAEVLSHPVAAGLYGKIAQKELSEEVTPTAMVVADMEQLFDAVNGDSSDLTGRPLLKPMTPTSRHTQCFSKLKMFFKEMTFVGATEKPISQEGWLMTLNAIDRLFKHLKTTYKLKYLFTKRLNKVPLENCFDCIRKDCGSNPTTTQFVTALKTNIITNLIK